jgi:hypothetical protein
MRALQLLVRDRFHWDRMMVTICHWVTSCPDCQACDYAHHEDPRRLLDAPTLFSKINIDVVFMPVNVPVCPRPGCLPEKVIVMA